MRKILAMAIALLMASPNVNAQDSDSPFTFNTRAWSTNYFTMLIYASVTEGIKHFAFDGNSNDSLWAERIIPKGNIVFPIGMGKSGFSDGYDIYSPYHRAFANPIKHIGDYAIGLDASMKPAVVGFYGGLYFKSQEVEFKHFNKSIRGFYFQPRFGLLVGSHKNSIEAGVFYDVLTGCGGSLDGVEKDMLKGGLGLDFGLSRADKKGKYVVQFSMPLHNFFNTDYAGQHDLKRKVGYIMCTRRIFL